MYHFRHLSVSEFSVTTISITDRLSNHLTIKLKMEDELDAMFDRDGEDENFNAQTDIDETEKLNELAALFSEDEEEIMQENKSEKPESPCPESENNDEKLKEEYEMLQRQMEELKQKMNKSLSPKNNGKQNAEVETKSEEKQESKNFLAAFGCIKKKSDKENVNIATSSTAAKISPPKIKLSEKIEKDKSFYGKRSREENENSTPEIKKRFAHENKNDNLLQNPKKSKFQRSDVLKGKQTTKAIVLATEKNTGLRLKKCLVSPDEVFTLMQGKKFFPLYILRPTMSISDVDWVTIAVVSKKTERQAAKNGKPFSIWNLVDLTDVTKVVTFFLFGRVRDQMKSIEPGTVIGLLNPSILPPKNDDKSKTFDNIPALTVDVPERIMNIGQSADIGWCNSTKWRNKQASGTCLNPVNRQYNDVCMQHMQSKYKKMSSKRGELHGSPAAPLPDKYKNTMWNKVKGDQFFYGGKTFSAAPPSLQTGKMPVSKIKLTRVQADRSDGQLSRSKVIGAMTNLTTEHSVTGCSDAFAEMLTSGDIIAGSRQFLGHLKTKQKLEEETVKPDKKLTPSQFLRQQKTLFETKNIQINPSPTSKTINKHSQISSGNLVNAVTIDDIKKQTKSIAQLKPKLSKPKLGAGNFEIDLSTNYSTTKSTTPTLAELRKRKALSKLRGLDGKVLIEKHDPNAVRSLLSGREVLKKVKLNRNDLAKKQPTKSPHEKTGKGFLGMKLSKEDIDRIVDMKSTHTDELEEAEAENEENYFNPRIQKEMIEKKMSETYEISTKIVYCVQCKYTFWGPHDRCKVMKHTLRWQDAVKRFFQCKCKHRCVTWMPYPTKTCKDCGSEKHWKRSSMLNRSETKILDSEILMIRGVEHEKFLNSL